MASSSLVEALSTDDLPIPIVLEIRDSAEWYVWTIDYLTSGPLLVCGNGAAADILQHAKAHLERRLRAYLCPSGLPRTEQQAMAMLKGLGQELAFAARELDAAAQALKFAGKVNQANHTKQSANRVKDVAEGLLD